MTVSRDLAIGQLNVANNGNDLLAILDIIAQENDDNSSPVSYQELSAEDVNML